jgi:D-glycero-D-manno-heptose 1,7-bisphosphate phosphatase
MDTTQSTKITARQAIFLDRDGVIIHNRANYVRSWADVRIYPRALRALARLAQLPTAIVVVSNQSAIGKGLLTLQESERINARIRELVTEQGGRLDAFYICPHNNTDHCQCRKPQPGMFLQAARDLHLDLATSWMVGDALTDMQAADAAGIPHRILVLSGRGRKQVKLDAGTPSFSVSSDLYTAAAIIHQNFPEIA